MANVHRGTVDVELDGETHQLRYTLNSLAEIEERLKLNSIGEIMDLLRALSMRSLRTLLWAGLIHAQPDLSEREVGEMEFDFSAVVARVSEAISLVFAPAATAGSSGGGTTGGNVERPAPGAGRKR